MNQKYFTVELASELHLGVPLGNMGAVAQFTLSRVCTVPGVANFWYGVVNYKGSLLWVLDSDRFFNLSVEKQKQPQKLTAVILNSEESVGQTKVAIVIQQLKGIVTLESSSLQPIADHVSPSLQECCSVVGKTESQAIHIIDATKLLQQLHQQSILVSA